MMSMNSDICWWSMSGTLNNFTSTLSLSPPVHIQAWKFSPSVAVLPPVSISNSSGCVRQHLHDSITSQSIHFCPFVASKRNPTSEIQKRTSCLDHTVHIKHDELQCIASVDLGTLKRCSRSQSLCCQASTLHGLCSVKQGSLESEHCHLYSWNNEMPPRCTDTN